MPTTINPADASGIPTSVTGPADGDLANAASVNGAFQRITDGIDVMRKALFGARLRPRYQVTNLGGGSNPVVTVQPLGGVLLTTGGGAVWTVLQHTVASAVDLTATLGSNLAIKTRYYLYIFNNSGAVAWNLSTTAPDSTLRYRSDSTDYAYVGTVLNDPSTANKVFAAQELGGGVHFLGTQQSGSAYVEVLSLSGTLTNSAVNVVNPAAYGQVVPAYAHSVLVNAQVNTAATTGDSVLVAEGSSWGAAVTVIAANGTAVRQRVVLTPNDGTNLYVSTTGTALATIDVLGWLDPR